jgi:Cys-rich four helix bundle protein (predicted Tat secretion target)
MNRRDLCLTSIGATVSLLALRAAATGTATEAPAKPSKHSPGSHHGTHEGHSGDKSSQIATAAANAVTKGLACADHCVEMLAQGERDMAECLEHVLDLVAVSEALAKLAANHSQHLGQSAKLAAAVAADCAKACDKHRKHMKTCQECYDACKDLEKACLGLNPQ